MNLLKEFQQFVKQQNLFQPKDKLLLAVSGGVDSVVLCELCKQAGFDFVIAHCNFKLRGDESDRDEKFVKALGEKYNVEVIVKKFDTEKYAAENKLSIQVAARELRYNWFCQLLNEKNGSLINETEGSPFTRLGGILTAHHANDNIETLLMNFFKGTGINGLHGILPKQGKLIRPLLFARKEELMAFAAENKLSFVEDSSNASDKYTRNYFRNELIPGLQKVYPQAEENLLNNIKRFREIEILYQQSVDQHKKKLLEYKGNEVHIPVLKLLKLQALNTVVYEIIKDYGFSAHQSGEMIDLLKSESGKYIQSSSHRIIKNRNWLIIAPVKNTEAQHILIEEKTRQVDFPIGKISIQLLIGQEIKLQSQNNTAQLDAGKIVFPLLLRKWKQGDYFYPLGMNKKKKLSRFFIDQKLSLTQKENTWVIEMDKKIIWVVGLRIDDRFKITEHTKDILQVTLTLSE